MGRSRVMAGVLTALVVTATPALAADRGPHVVAALRETLRLAIERGVAASGRADGFSSNPAIRVPIPDALSRVEAKLRLAGQERVIDRFGDSLNRVAEHAVSATRPALLAGAAEVPLDDGHRVLTGGETAATEALRRHVIGRVITTLNPVVANTMDQLGATRRYKRFMKDVHFGGLVQAPALDLDAYVVGRTVDGIFHAIGEEERRIRLNPAARTSPVLRRVFDAQR